MTLTKVDDRGLKTPIDLQDNEKIRLGTGNDLEIFHSSSSSNSIIDNISGQLIIKSDDFRLKARNNEQYLTATLNGPVNLYYDNSKKFETKSDGVDITGELQCDSLDVDGGATFTPGSGNFVSFFGASNHAKWDVSNSRFLFDDNAKAVFGDAADLQLYHNGTNSFIDNVTGDLNIRSNVIRFRAQSNEQYLTAIANGAVELYHNNSKKLETTSTGVTVTGRVTCDDLSFIPSGTKMLFQQTAAPSGWTKVTSGVNNSALRVVHGTAGSGGSNGFTTAFNSSRTTSGGDVLSHTLTTSQIPSHNHGIRIRSGIDDRNFTFNQGFTSDASNDGGLFNSESTGGGQGHDHGFTNPSFNLDVAYTDVIICTKD